MQIEPALLTLPESAAAIDDQPLKWDTHLKTLQFQASSLLVVVNKERCAVGDKSKKDKEKGQKQNVAKQKQKMDKKIEKQPKRAS